MKFLQNDYFCAVFRGGTDGSADSPGFGNILCMGLFDIIVLVCFLIALCIGLKKGFIAQVVSLVSLCLGVWLAVTFSAPVSRLLEEWTSIDGDGMKIAAFVLIFCVTVLVLTLAGRILEKIIRVVMLGWLNRLLGAALAAVEWLLILCIALMIFDALNGTFSFVKTEYLESTVFYEPLKTVSHTIFPRMKELFLRN